MHRRLGSMTVAAGFPRRRQPKFPKREIPLGQYSWKKFLKKYMIVMIYNRPDFVIRSTHTVARI